MTTQSTTISKSVEDDLDVYEISDEDVSTSQEESDILEDANETIENIDTDQDLSSSTDLKEETIAKIKGLDILKEGIYSVDLEKTISDMYSVIKSMESQLQKVLNINELLEKELDDAKQRILTLTKNKTDLEQTIAHLEEEMPTKHEMRIEMDHIIDERNKAHSELKDLKQRLKNAQHSTLKYQHQAHELSEEKRDIIADITFLESRLNISNDKLIRYEKAVKSLKGEKLTLMAKLNAVEDELNESLQEKSQMMKDLKESKMIMSEIHDTLTDSRRQAKRVYYEGS